MHSWTAKLRHFYDLPCLFDSFLHLHSVLWTTIMVTMAIPTFLLSSHRRLLDSKHKTRSPDQHETTTVMLCVFFSKTDRKVWEQQNIQTQVSCSCVSGHMKSNERPMTKSAHIQLPYCPNVSKQTKLYNRLDSFSKFQFVRLTCFGLPTDCLKTIRN